MIWKFQVFNFNLKILTTLILSIKTAINDPLTSTSLHIIRPRTEKKGHMERKDHTLFPLKMHWFLLYLLCKLCVMHLTFLICQKMFSKRMIQKTENQQKSVKIVVTQNFFESSQKLRKAPPYVIPGFHTKFSFSSYTWFRLHTTTDLSSSALRIISNLLSLLTKCILTKFSLNFCKDLLVVQLPKFLQYLQIVSGLSESVNKSQCRAVQFKEVFFTQCYIFFHLLRMV